MFSPVLGSTCTGVWAWDRNRILEWTAGWSELPNILICIVFGTLFMGERIPPVGEVWRVSGPQLMYGQILAWGQYAIPALLTAVLLEPALGSNVLVAPVVALGFEGGHGTAAGIKQSFVSLGFSSGGDLALCAATVGLVSGICFGTLLVNLAVRKRWIDSVDTNPSVALTLLAGYAAKRLLELLEGQSAWLTEYHFFSAFPTFPFCMFAGILIQLACDKWAAEPPLDRDTIERVSGLALEYTITSAVAIYTATASQLMQPDATPYTVAVCCCCGWWILITKRRLYRRSPINSFYTSLS
ncbi:uncharacterized protein MONBRDRAFT_26972 [Monosiga brevicollis MX1]|uniref:Uncharacterized protein n=1 Tax=Monosiga brevicollis TaxID=81824 RepID=A9V3G9_MONBE|nr:uncharacterized protein MONBRDRAFT_26972 [Monosiga brevicollis MX1]EDQ87910.1 predicted protein [Monosiga brevicollis MX1]|eukprot:XP_001747443.1 hypothetical protein [Monosiga brevicollis MX1]